MGEQVAARINGDVAQLGEHLPCKQGLSAAGVWDIQQDASSLLGSSRMDGTDGGYAEHIRERSTKC